jgi:hypothetical protein
MRNISFVVILITLIQSSWADTATPYPIDGPLGGVPSPHTEFVLNLVRNGPSPGLPHPVSPNIPIYLRKISTPNSPYYIGLEQVIMIRAPLEKVAAVLDDFSHYQDLLVGFKDIHVSQQDGNQFLIHYEQIIPVFFIPNVKYEMIFRVDDTKPGRKIYRYQLKSPTKVKTSDGMAWIENVSKSSNELPLVRYVKYDFFDAEWGVLKTIKPGAIWKNSVEAFFLADVAIALKAEHPDWEYSKVRSEAEKLLERFPLESVLK